MICRTLVSFSRSISSLYLSGGLVLKEYQQVNKQYLGDGERFFGADTKVGRNRHKSGTPPKRKNSFQQVVLYTCTKYALLQKYHDGANFEKINGQEEFDCSIFVFG